MITKKEEEEKASKLKFKTSVVGGEGRQVTECDTRRVGGVDSGILRMRLQTCPE